MDRALTTRRAIRIALLALIPTLAASARADAIRYAAADLGAEVDPYGLNNLGQVVGVKGSFAQTPVLISGGVTTTLDGYAHAINDSGQLAIDTPYDQFIGFAPAAINAAGVQAGSLRDNLLDSRPATVIQGGGDSELGVQAEGSATAINDKGQVAGWIFASSAGNHSAFVSSGGHATDLSSSLGTDSMALAINNAGQVVGYGTDPATGKTFPFLYADGKVTNLGGIVGFGGQAFGINDSGQVIGATTPGGAGFESYLYQDGKVIDLTKLASSTLGIDHFGALEINDAGQIVGTGYLGGVGHAFLLSPSAVPEPTALATLAGLALVLARRRRVAAGAGCRAA